MIIEEVYSIGQDGTKLIKRHSDRGMLIRQSGTGDEYVEAIDLESAPFTYVETDIPIDEDGDGYLDAQEALDAILGEEVSGNGETDTE